MKRLLAPARRIGWRIIAPYAALTIVLAVAGTYLVTQLVSDSLDERFNNQLVEASGVAADSLVRRERKHLEAVRAISFTSGVPDAVVAGDPAAIRTLVEPLAANAALERVELVGRDGQRLYAAKLSDRATFTYAPISDGDDPRAWTLVEDVLAGAAGEDDDKSSEIVYTASGYVLYTAGPIYRGSEIVGAALAGTPLQSFLATAQAEALADVTFYGPTGAPLASTFPPDERGVIDLRAPDRVTAVDAANQMREHRTLYGRDYDLLYSELRIRDATVGYYSVALPSSFIFNAQAATRTQMAVLFTAAIAAALVIGLLIARTITGPVSKLVATVHQVRRGDLTARSHVRGDDEIGTLGSAFDDMTERLQQQLLATVRALTSAIDARDPSTHGHSLRVGELSVILGRELGLDGADLQHLQIGGYLHDVGKIGVRDAVLLKPGELTPEERTAIERHPLIGMDILAHAGLAPEVLEFVGGHHEKLAGTGYPRKLRDHELSIYARIATVADIYDALVTDRPYRAGMSADEAMAMLRDEVQRGAVDGRIVDALERVLPAWEQRRRDEPLLSGVALTIEHQDAA